MHLVLDVMSMSMSMLHSYGPRSAISDESHAPTALHHHPQKHQYAPMVSLFEILLQKPLWAHLTSGLPALDAMLSLQSDAILDLQSVPTNPAFYVMLCHMMCSHLSKSEETSVVVLETINDFPWDLLRRHSLFQSSWISNNRITKYNLDSFSKLYAFFKLMPLLKPSGSVLVLITNFHELLELYRYQFSATHEEYMLKHQIEKYRVLIQNKDKAHEEGIESVELPELPANSLLRENPYFRCQTHIHELFSLMSSWAVKECAVILLLGHMEPKYIASQIESRKATPSGSSQAALPSSSQYEQRKLTLTPVTFADARGDKQSPAESKISCKLMFYYDWYFHSPHFKSESRPITAEDHYLVSVVKVLSVTGLKNITEPIYFDFKHSTSATDSKILSDCFINLSDTEKNHHSEGLSSLIQETISSTQVYSRQASDANRGGETERTSNFAMPSSPPQSVLNVQDPDISVFPTFQPASQSQDLDPKYTNSEFPSVIDASDVESTGILLEDMEENYSDDSNCQCKNAGEASDEATDEDADEDAMWLARHS